MMLNDEIQRLANGRMYPAYVYSAQMAAPPDTGTGGATFFALEDQLRAVVEPGTSWGSNEQVRWNDRTYQVSRVALRKRHGEPHHYTLTLERI